MEEENPDYAEKAIENVEFLGLTGTETIGEYLNDPEIVHFSYVKDAYESERYSMVIILLSTFFESFITSQLKLGFMHIKANRETKGATEFIEDINFEKKLKFARILGVVNENQFDIINKVREARNKFAHGIKSYSPSNQSKIMEEVRLKDAIKLYENFMNIPESITEE